jgi:hypothetical protein
VSAGGPVPETLPALPDEARRMLDRATAAQVPLRLVGGIAIRLRCPSARVPPLARSYKDVDYIGRAADRDAIRTLFEDEGYAPDAEFNALHGLDRLMFWDHRRERHADVFLDGLAMCHTLELADRLTLDEDTVSLADLLLLKLQVVETNERDYLDALALLADHRIGEGAIDGAYIAALLASDWGWWRTACATLDRVERFGRALPGFESAPTVAGRIGELRELIDAAPKRRRWRLRARVGDRVRWYEQPEETH